MTSEQRRLLENLLSLRGYFAPEEVQVFEQVLQRNQRLSSEQEGVLEGILADVQRQRDLEEKEDDDATRVAEEEQERQRAQQRRLAEQRDLLNQLLALRAYLGRSEAAQLEQWLAGSQVLAADRLAALSQRLQEVQQQRQVAESEAAEKRRQVAAQRELLDRLLALREFLEADEVERIEGLRARDAVLGQDQMQAVRQQLAQAEERQRVAAAEAEKARQQVAAQQELLDRLITLRRFLDPEEANRLEQWRASDVLLGDSQLAALRVRLEWAEERQLAEVEAENARKLAAQRDLLNQLLALRRYLEPDEAAVLKQQLAGDDLLPPDELAALEGRLDAAEGRRLAEAAAEEERQLTAQRDLIERVLALRRYLDPGEITRLEEQLAVETLLGADQLTALERRRADAERRETADRLIEQRELMNRLLALRSYLDPQLAAALEQRLGSEALLTPDQVAALEARLEAAQERQMAARSAEEQRQLAAQRDLIDRLLELRRHLGPEDVARLERERASAELFDAAALAALEQELAAAEGREAAEKLTAQRDLLTGLLALRQFLDPQLAAGLEQRLASETLLEPARIAALEKRLEEAQERRMAEIRAEEERELAAQRDLINRMLTLRRYLDPETASGLEEQLASDVLLEAGEIAALERALAAAEQRRQREQLVAQRELLNQLVALRPYLDPAEVEELERQLASDELFPPERMAALKRRRSEAEQRRAAELAAEEEERRLAAQRETIARLLALDAFLTPAEIRQIEPLSDVSRPIDTTQMAQIEQLLEQAEQRRPTLLFYEMPRPRPL